jgi:recombination protein RecT
MAEPSKTNLPAGTQKPTVPANAPKTIRELLAGEALKKEFAMALPKICTVERFIRVALTAINKTPKLLDCTRESVLASLYKCAELGLEPDGRRAHLIPYGTQCTVIIDYKGKVELAMRSGTVAVIHADKICENDVFVFDRGEVKKHEIDFRKDRGKAFAYYCLVRMKDGTEKAEVMTLAEVNDIRKRSKAGDSGPWKTDFDEMAKKTVFHRASKWITLSPELRSAEELEDTDGFPVTLSTKGITLEIPAEITNGEDHPADSQSMAAAAETGKVGE